MCYNGNMADKITWSNEKRKLSELVPWERNPRQITDKQAKRLEESFEQFGQVEIIAIGPENQIYNGHQRLKVLNEKYGADYEVDVRVASRALTEKAVSYTHLRAHETVLDLVCRLLLEKKKTTTTTTTTKGTKFKKINEHHKSHTQYDTMIP